jgi:hypothetical protein
MINEEEKLIYKNATLEAIYWWNRDEHYYHNYFNDFENIYKNKKLLKFFTTKIFEIFLRDYSIRRNIEKGYKNVDLFIDELFEHNFVKRVKKGEIEVVDEVSNKLKITGNTTNGKEVRSLLSKIAFLINPSEFSLIDSLVKDSLWSIIKDKKNCKRNELEYYSEFIKQTKIQLQTNSEIIKTQMKLLEKFENTYAFQFFSKNPKAFERRIYDKYLWIKKQNKNIDGRKIDNNEYLELESTKHNTI